MITYTLEATDFNLIATFNFTQVLPQRPSKRPIQTLKYYSSLLNREFYYLELRKAASYSSASKKVTHETDYPPSCYRKAVRNRSQKRAREILKIANIKNDCLNYSEKRKNGAKEKRRDRNMNN